MRKSLRSKTGIKRFSLIWLIELLNAIEEAMLLCLREPTAVSLHLLSIARFDGRSRRVHLFVLRCTCNCHFCELVLPGFSRGSERHFGDEHDLRWTLVRREIARREVG